MKKKSVPGASWNGQKLILPMPKSVPDDIISFLKAQDKYNFANDDTVGLIQACDVWCKKEILKNPNAKHWMKDERYPFKEYTHVSELLRRHAKEFVKDLYRKCPIKGRQLYDIYDSAALVIFKNRLDPWSLINVTAKDNQSFWDKISEEGQV